MFKKLAERISFAEKHPFRTAIVFGVLGGVLHAIGISIGHRFQVISFHGYNYFLGPEALLLQYISDNEMVAFALYHILEIMVLSLVCLLFKTSLSVMAWVILVLYIMSMIPILNISGLFI